MSTNQAKALVKIGVVGYCPPTKFDQVKALAMIQRAYDEIESAYPDQRKMIVSGLTDVGIIAIAYREAVRRSWKTMGIASHKAFDFELFPVDKKIIQGNNWSDESPIFLNTIDAIIRIGGGKQSLAETLETKRRGKPAIEFDLPPE